MANSSPLISVIMPVFNVEKYIDEAIKSILNQTYTHFELLICDDGSHDKTLENCKKYQSQDKRIRVFSNSKNKGNLKTTNFLLKQCKGEFITIQDGDDYSKGNRFELLLNAFFLNPEIGMVGSNYMAVSFDKKPLFCGVLPLHSFEIEQEMNKHVIPLLYASLMVRKGLVDQVGDFSPFFNRKGYADFDWMARISEKTKVLNLKEVLYIYRKHYASFTSRNKVPFSEVFHELIVQMHHRRKEGKEDYFRTNNQLGIRKMISNIYLRKVEQCFWNNKLNINGLVYNSFKAYPLNLKLYKTLFYILRKRND